MCHRRIKKCQQCVKLDYKMIAICKSESRTIVCYLQQNKNYFSIVFSVFLYIYIDSCSDCIHLNSIFLFGISLFLFDAMANRSEAHNFIFLFQLHRSTLDAYPNCILTK